MTIEMFLFLLTLLSAVTSILTEGIKKYLDAAEVKYSANIVVLIVALIVGSCGTLMYYMFNYIPWTAQNIACVVLMTVANWIGAMVGYDKVIQTIKQIKSK